jgi:hypothetical protein
LIGWPADPALWQVYLEMSRALTAGCKLKAESANRRWPYGKQVAAQTTDKKRKDSGLINMGRVRRGGYIIEWFIGDHAPRHVHVYDSKGRFLGRLNLETLVGLEDWSPSDKLVELISELKAQGKL